MSIVKRIKYLCEINGTKIKPLEEHLGFSNGSVRFWDSSSPSCDRALKVAEYFNVSLDWLITGKDTLNDLPLHQDEIRLIKYYNLLNDTDKCKVIHFMEIASLKNES